MEEIIEIDLHDKYDLVSKYNEDKLSNELLEYIIKQAMLIKKDKKIKIMINKKGNINIDSAKLIKEGLKEEYTRSIHERNSNNKKQLVFLLLGMTIIFLSTLIKERGFWKELIIITGWVPIWEMVEIELFPDVYGRRKRRMIRRLLNSEIVEL